MTSPPSIFTQPPGSVPSVTLDGLSHFESTEIGFTPFELPKHRGLPRTRAASVAEGVSVPSFSQQALNAISKGAAVTSEGLHLEASVLAHEPEEQDKPRNKRTWHRRGSAQSPDKLEWPESTQHKRPKLTVPSFIKHREHSASDSSVPRRTAAGAAHVRRRKISRLSRDDSDIHTALDPIDFADFHDQGPISPLFFSHTPNHRPPIAPRFSSIESGAQLLDLASMDDTGGGGAVRTVKMARGSMGAMSPPPQSPSTHAPRPPSMHLRAITGRASNSKGTTPDSGTGDDRDKESMGSGLQTLSQAGVLELLDQDDRPTFVLDVTYKTNFQPGPLHVSFINGSLRAYPGLSEAIRGRGSGNTPAFSPTPSFPEFKAWVTSFVSKNECMDVTLPAYVFAGFVWRASALKKRFRVVSGILANGAPLGVPAISTPGGSSVNNVPRNAAVSLLYEEPADYFGHQALPSVLESSNENENNEGADADASVRENERGDVARLKLGLDINRPVSVLGEQLKGSAKVIEDSSLSSTQIVSGPRSGDELPERNPQTSGSLDQPDAAGESGMVIDRENFEDASQSTQYYFDWTRLPLSASLPRHIQFARNVDWASTSLGPIESWSGHLRATTCLIMASPHPAAMYWGDDNVAIYNEPYILLAGQKHPGLMGTAYEVAWKEIWHNVKDSFAQAKLTGQSTMKDDDRLFINRSGFLEETYFSWSIIPLVGDDGGVIGLYNPAFEKTRRKIAERRMLTLREVGEKTAAAREVKSFWGAVLSALEYNEYDTPFVLLYSVSDDENSDGSSIHSNSILGAKQVTLEGSLPELPYDHPAAPQTIDLRNGEEGFGPVFREAMMNDKHILLETANGTLDQSLLDDMAWRGFNEKPRAAVVSPIHPTTGESIIGFLVMGVNPRRPYDDDYNLFVTLLTRQLATSMASVVLFEEEIRRGQRAARLAALDRIELSQQLEARTKEALESETKFTRMAEFAPVGIFIANREGDITFTNSVFHSLTHLPVRDSGEKWMELVKDEDKHILEKFWDDVVHKGLAKTAEIRFKGEWKGGSDAKGEIWVLCSAFPEKYFDGSLKSIFGSLTDISQQKWAEAIQIKRSEEAIELKRQQSNFIDMTSHEMRNPLSAILQSADEITYSLTELRNSKEHGAVAIDLIDSAIDAAQTISLCANHQTRIVSDVLTLSKLDSALLLVTPVDVQPRVIVHQAMKMFEGEMQTADITLNLKIDKSLDELSIDWVRLDPSRLLQVLINLMTNAIKFTTPEASRSINISLTASREPPAKTAQPCVDYIPRSIKTSNPMTDDDWGTGERIYLNFAVQDTGKGLNDDEKKLLFLRFSQANPKTHVRYGGSGLGLFISRELVELQGGEIGVSSEAGKGSTFAFYIQARKSTAPSNDADGEASRNLITSGGMSGLLRKPSVTRSTRPRISGPTPSKLPTVPADDEPNGNSEPIQKAKPKFSGLEYLKILIVEDNLVNQKVLAKQLRNIGCVVSVANHGQEALEHLRKTRYWPANKGNADALELSVILMDLEMPVMDGLTCTRRIREMEANGELLGHSPIIAVSANARSAHVDSALEAGMDDVVSKPFRIPDLVPKMEQLVETHRDQQRPSAEMS